MLRDKMYCCCICEKWMYLCDSFWREDSPDPFCYECFESEKERDIIEIVKKIKEGYHGQA